MSPDAGRGRRTALAAAALVGVLTLAIYWQALDFQFLNFDDNAYVTSNPAVRGGLSSRGVAWALTTMHQGNWHPLTWLSHMLDVTLYGTDPYGHHLTSLVVHVANVLMLFAILRIMTGALWKSLFVAALFAVHPLHVESVAWVSERKDVLSTFFWLLTILAYVFYAARPAGRRYALVIIAFALGLMAKPMLVSLPLVLLLLDYWPLARKTVPTNETRQTDEIDEADKAEQIDATVPEIQCPASWRSLVIEKLPLIAMSLASCVVTIIAQSKATAVISTAEAPLAARLANASVAYAEYLLRMVWPSRLCCFYPYSTRLPLYQVIPSALFLVAATVLAVRLGRRHRYLAVGWFWYLVTLLPVIGLVQVGGQSSADRYTYVPLIGILIILAWGIPDLAEWALPGLRKPISWGLAAAAIAVVAALSIAANTQLAYWKDSVTVLERAIAVTKDNAVAEFNLGSAYQVKGDYQNAEAHYRQALRLKPNNEDVEYSLGNVLGDQGKWPEAVRHLLRATKLEPKDASAHNSLGSALLQTGRTDEALRHFLTAVRVNRRYGLAHANAALVLAAKRDYFGAWQHITLAQKYGGALPQGFAEFVQSKLQGENR